MSEKREKTILIECVENGWIVRPFSPNRWQDGISCSSRLWVFSDLKALLESVSEIIEVPDEGFSVSNHIPNEPL